MITALIKFLRQTRGNVAMMFAMAVAPTTVAIGGAVDYTRSTMIGLEIQNALDSGVLAAASLTQGRDPNDVVRAYVFAALEEYPQIDPNTLVVNIQSNNTLNSRQVTASAEIELPTIMLGLLGKNTLRIKREAIAIEEVRNIEIALVLDTSGSMGGSKIQALRDAAEDFIDVVLTEDSRARTSVSVIPYNGGVRLPSEVNTGFLQGALNVINQSGCPDMGTTYPTVMDLPDNTLNMLEWDGLPVTGWRNNSMCPRQSAESMFLSNNATALKTLVSNLPASGYTGLDVATGWGLRALDPSWQGDLGGDFPGRPAAYTDDETLKILVVMTDGEATAQYRRSWSSYYGGYWYTSSLYSAWTARQNMTNVCDQAKDQGVQVYTIAFQLNSTTARELMAGCASSANHFYDVQGLDIESAFSSIAAAINALRLTS